MQKKFGKIAFCDIFTISKIALRGRMLVQNYYFLLFYLHRCMTGSIEKNKSHNILFKWSNIIIEWEWSENHILANIFSKNRVGVQKCQILSPPPFPAISSTRFCIETPGNNSRHVDKCCTAGLGISLNMALFLCVLQFCSLMQYVWPVFCRCVLHVA